MPGFLRRCGLAGALALAPALSPAHAATGANAGVKLIVSERQTRVISAVAAPQAQAPAITDDALIQPSLKYQKRMATLQLLGRPRSETVLFLPATVPANVWTAVKSLQQVRPLPTLAPIHGLSKSVGVAAFTQEGNSQNLQTHALKIEPEFMGDGGAGIAPPDMQLAVGDEFVLQVDNSSVTAWLKSGAKVANWPLAGVFFQDASVSDAYELHATDPWVQYDRQAHRFFVSALVQLSQTYVIWLGISEGEDPRGAWEFRRIAFPPGFFFPDQPKLTVTSDKLLIAWDDLENTKSTSDDVQVGGNWTAISKQELLTSSSQFYISAAYSIGDPCLGAPLAARNTEVESAGYIIAAVPPDLQSSCPAAMRSPSPSVAPGTADTLTVLRIDGEPPNLLTSSASYHVAPYSAPGNTAPNPSAGNLGPVYDSGDTRVLSAIKIGNQLYAAANGSCQAWPACIRLWNLGIASTTNNPVFDVNIGLAGSYLMYPSLTSDGAGNVVGIASQISNGRMGALLFYDVSQNGRFSALTFSPPAPGVSCPFRDLTATRFGDYAGSDADPSEGDAIWVVAALPPTPEPGQGADTSEHDWYQCPQSSKLARIVIKAMP